MLPMIHSPRMVSVHDMHTDRHRKTTMDVTTEPGIWQTLVLLFHTLGTLVIQLTSLGLHWLVWIVWIAWCLWAVNWWKTRHFLAIGGWAPAVLLIVLIAIVWSRIDARACDCLGVISLPNFWWQLGYVSMLAAVAMFCGWLQSAFHWTPHDINLDPPAHSHGHGSEHAHAHH
jgi:magnesium-transporting ATPase (P-type)